MQHFRSNACNKVYMKVSHIRHIQFYSSSSTLIQPRNVCVLRNAQQITEFDYSSTTNL
jgi:hypothetical protein